MNLTVQVDSITTEGKMTSGNIKTVFSLYIPSEICLKYKINHSRLVKCWYHYFKINTLPSPTYVYTHNIKLGYI